MSNPIKRAWPADWSGAAEASYLKKYWPSYGDSALRLRHGARVACKRLRGELTEALDTLTDAVRVAQRLANQRDRVRALARRLTTERDAARLELRALEWLALHGYPVGRDPDGDRVMAVYREADLEPDWQPTWSSAARALGWEG